MHRNYGWMPVAATVALGVMGLGHAAGAQTSTQITAGAMEIQQSDAQSGPEDISANVPNAGPDSRNWRLVPALSDEFNGSDLDTSKWDDAPQSWGIWTWSADNVSVENGALALRIRPDDQPNAVIRDSNYKTSTKHTYFSSGIIQSKANQVYGYYEARVKGVDTFPGSAPAFWLYSNLKNDQAAGFVGKADGDPAYSEVDIVEMQQHPDDPHVMDMHAPYQVIRNGKPTWIRNAQQAPYLDHKNVKVDFDPAAAFHTYGVMVAPDRLTWYIDGKEVNSLPNTNWNRLPMNVTLSLGLREPNMRYGTKDKPCPGKAWRCAVPPKVNADGSVDGYPARMLVDWVRVYAKKPGTGAF